VSITGALDDAASCLNGGINFADNLKRRLIRSEAFPRPLRVVIRVPRLRSRRGSVKLQFLRRFSKLADLAYEMGEGGDRWGAMVLNGMVYSSLLEYDVSPAMKALSLGALGSGLSGTGPAVSAVFEEEADDEKTGAIELLRKNWARDGSKVIVTESNNEHGGMVRLDH
jgi:shikimate kinase